MKHFLLVLITCSCPLLAMNEVPSRPVKKQKTKRITTIFERKVINFLNFSRFPQNQRVKIKKLGGLLQDIVVEEENIKNTIEMLMALEELNNAQQSVIQLFRNLPNKKLKEGAADILSNLAINGLVQPVSSTSVLKSKDLDSIKKRLKKNLTKKTTKK